MQKRVTWLFFITLAIPFVLMRDIYPMFRFGMFAEPRKKETLNENISIYCGTSALQLKTFDASEIKINHSVFEQIKRKYYYTQQSEKLLKILDSLTGFRYPYWKLERIAYQNLTYDTISIAILR
ncbi:MAG: hypothetical protein NZM38_05275 [Cytophagales bacterium]|nr:hypothetical protein [Cytophagales bacterium]MDW8384165.1 hypothetical protein [Flammeovirgaceae bacterium]